MCSGKNEHIDNRINACRRAYYAMQSTGFCNGITDIDTLAYVWNAAIRPVLTYGIKGNRNTKWGGVR